MGRKSTNDIVIKDKSASRIHAEINCQEELVTILDLGSTNGTYVNHKRLTSTHKIEPGDQIRIGHHLASLSKINILEDRPDNGGKDDFPTLATQPLTTDFLLESYELSAVLIYEVANRLTTVLDLDNALQEIVNFLKTAIGAEKCQIIFREQFDNFNKLGLSASIAKKAIEDKSVVVVPDPQKSTAPSKTAQYFKIRTALCVPILRDSETIALVYCYKTDPTLRPFDQHDIYLAVAVSHQVALAIQRSQILDKAKILEEWAFTDSLTGLDNRRQILRKGEIECSRTNRYQHPLAVLMIDIDDFKQINDTYGHPIGDEVLKAVASRSHAQLRDVDLIGRYGGDEFLIFLVETTLDNAVIVAERLLRSISDYPVTTEKGRLKVTISMGITFVQEDYADLDDLIHHADDALLRAKKEGKNSFEVVL